jgi:hypothetical protein
MIEIKRRENAIGMGFPWALNLTRNLLSEKRNIH